MPYAFSEQGVAMLSSVLRSRKAVAVNIEIIRALVRLRRAAASLGELGRTLDALERRYDERFRVVFQALRELMQPPAPPRKVIGFSAGELRPARQRMARVVRTQVRRSGGGARSPAPASGT